MLRDFFKRRAAKRKLAQAEGEFDALARALIEANLAARASGKTSTRELLSAAEKTSSAAQELLQAKRDCGEATVGTEAVDLTDVVRRKVCQLFPLEEQVVAIHLLEKECGRGLPFQESANPSDLERVRLAVLKLSEGKLAVLRQQIHLAKTDWRDVLLAAEQPEALKFGLVNYTKLTADKRDEIDARDRQQYDLWLHD